MPPQYWLYGLAPLYHWYTLARISCWPPEDGSICDPKHVGVNFTWTFNVFLINIKLWAHELVIIGLVISMHGLNMKDEICHMLQRSVFFLHQLWINTPDGWLSVCLYLAYLEEYDCNALQQMAYRVYILIIHYYNIRHTGVFFPLNWRLLGKTGDGV